MIRLEHISTNHGERNFSEVFNQYGIDTNRAELLPGHYYAFNVSIPNFDDSWIPNNRDDYKENPTSFITDREYFDLNPMGPIFHHKNWKDTVLILNLKVIPPTYRSAIIMTHLNLIEQNLDKLGLFDDDMELVPIAERRRMNMPLFGVTPSMLQELSKFKLGYALSGYKLSGIDAAKMLDWDRIGELPEANLDVRGLVLSPGTLDITSVFNKFEDKQYN